MSRPAISSISMPTIATHLCRPGPRPLQHLDPPAMHARCAAPTHQALAGRVALVGMARRAGSMPECGSVRSLRTCAAVDQMAQVQRSLAPRPDAALGDRTGRIARQRGLRSAAGALSPRQERGRREVRWQRGTRRTCGGLEGIRPAVRGRGAGAHTFGQMSANCRGPWETFAPEPIRIRLSCPRAGSSALCARRHFRWPTRRSPACASCPLRRPWQASAH